MGCIKSCGRFLLILCSLLLIIFGVGLIIFTSVFTCFSKQFLREWSSPWIIVIGSVIPVLVGVFMLKALCCTKTVRRIEVVAYTAAQGPPHTYIQAPYNPFWSQGTLDARIMVQEYSNPTPAYTYEELPPSYDSVVKSHQFIHPHTVPNY